MQRPGPMAKRTFSLLGTFKWHQAPSGSSALILLLRVNSIPQSCAICFETRKIEQTSESH